MGQLGQAPTGQLGGELLAEELVDVEPAAGIGVRPQQPVALDGGELDEAEARRVHVTEVVGLGKPDQ